MFYKRCSVPETLIHVFSCKFCKSFKNIPFTEHIWTTASEKMKYETHEMPFQCLALKFTFELLLSVQKKNVFFSVKLLLNELGQTHSGL